MISYRLKGLINLQIAATAILLTSYLFVLAIVLPYTPFKPLNPDVNLLLYSTPVLVGLTFSGRFWAPLAGRFHIIKWTDAAAVTSRQIALVALLVFGLVVATKDRSVSRLFLAFYLLSGWLILLLINRWFPTYLARLAFQRRNRIPALFIGRRSSMRRLESWIHQKEHLGIQIVGLVSNTEPPNGVVGGVPHLGTIDNLRAIIDDRGIGQVIVLDLPSDQSELVRVIETCQSTGSRLLIYQNIWDKLPIQMMPVIEQEHLFLTVHDEPLEDPFNRGIKRLYDIAISFPVVVLVLPLLCVMVWVIQRIQAPGPLMFKRARGGQRGHNFEMLKFRSMYAAKHDPNIESRQATQGDPRIYRFGHFLRKTSLDEFPQFLNVLMGDMSIVGPRPHLPEHDEEFSSVAKTYRTRQLVKPGITGMAQVHGLRGEISDPALLYDRVKLDIFYITHWSIWLDISITARTLLQIFFPPKSAR